LFKENIYGKGDFIYNEGVSTKGEPIAPRADLSAQCYSLPPVDAGSLAALGRRSGASITIVTTAVAVIISAAATGEATFIFGVFVDLSGIFQ
jgi:hypothetical protein